MNKIVFITIVILTALNSGLYGQDVSDYYIPYGFRLPNLRAGQYLLSVRGDYEDLKYNRKSDHNYEIDRKTDLNSYASAMGVLR